MPTLKLFRCLTPLLAVVIVLAACADQPSIPPQALEPSAVRSPVATSPSIPTNTVRTEEARPSPTATPSPSVVPNPTVDPITGASGFARGAITRRPVIAMIDNHPDAYPQVGLNQAAVVFEALAEFGITRFMALYVPGLSPNVPKIGPVRSTRTYFVQWAMGFHALYVHAGGSPSGLELAEHTDQLVNLDALHKGSGGYFYRDSQRVAPHNLFTSSSELERALQDRHALEFPYPDMGFLFKTDVEEDQRPAAQALDYFFIYKKDNAGWIYDPTTNGYLRTRRGKAARDGETGEQLWSKNIVAIEVHEQRIAGDEKGRIEQEVIGTGPGRVFMDGVEYEITWRKADAAAPLLFYNHEGQEFRFNAGPIWIVVLPSLKNVMVS